MDGAMAEGGTVRVTRIGALVEIVLSHPPVNALGATMRVDLAAAVDQAEAGGAEAVLIRGDGPIFSAGADIGEMGSNPVALPLGHICDRIEGLSLPVVVLLSGPAIGGGLELALAAHLRLAVEGAHVSLPEVHLGLLPGAGGTQRLPRLVGAEVALDLMLTGRVLPAAEALAIGVIDRVIPAGVDAVAEARAAALTLAQSGTWRRTGDLRDGFRDVTGYRAALDAARQARRGGRLPAPGRIVDCVEAALLLPLEQGLAFESAAFGDLAASVESVGLRHAFRAERAARRVPAAFGRIEAKPPVRLSIWGAGGMAPMVARRALEAGFAVMLADPDRDVLVAALETVAAAQEAAVQAGGLTPEARDADWARLLPAIGPARLGEAELVLTTRSDLVLSAPRAVLALGVPSPAGAMALSLVDQAQPLAELVLDGVAPQRAALALAFARKMGWTLVTTGPGGPIAAALATALAEAVSHMEARKVPRAVIAQALALAGIAGEGREGTPSRVEEVIARRCLGALANAGARLIEAGVARDAAVVDWVAIAAGIVARWTGGPMHQADRRGLLVLRRDLKVWAAEAPALYSPAPLLDRLIGEGRGFGA
ncbi:enoyl-CoA hydratase-related protein [Fuscovulum ytuae]|uniref:Enoyl-CoA hydratase-related protein n=1 Tax=Fuscovulum ytuae TaxID=3042299 RepID=A0ABY8Q7I0_9RHOB|nr:enoyl-CoA hydratase-related protein [Fuscovulum sp. YMD61]WGV16823.1 enoyl-CoA hydratase-related protein [Fuscovulum sp. YMD61]